VCKHLTRREEKRKKARPQRLIESFVGKQIQHNFPINRNCFL